MAIRILPKALEIIAKNELNEDPKRIQEDLNYIQEWIMKQPHLNARNDNQLYLTFLRNAKFSLERAKEKIDQYYTMRSIAPELYDRDPFSPELQAILKQGIILVSKDDLKPSLPGLMIVRWSRTDPEKFSALNILKVIVMMLDIMMIENDNIIINGIHFIGDFKGISLKYLPQFTPSISKKFIVSLQDVTPIRLRGINIINVPSYFETILNITKTFVKDKMQKRYNVYGENFQDLYQRIPVSILPKEYGGEARSLDDISDEWKRKMESYRDWFLDDSRYGTNETKRPGKSKLASDIFGTEGSFRTLNID